MYGKGGYFDRNKEWAEKLGWGVMNYILDVDVSKIPPYKDEFGGGKAVTPLPPKRTGVISAYAPPSSI